MDKPPKLAANPGALESWGWEQGFDPGVASLLTWQGAQPLECWTPGYPSLLLLLIRPSFLGEGKAWDSVIWF